VCTFATSIVETSIAASWSGWRANIGATSRACRPKSLTLVTVKSVLLLVDCTVF